MSAINKLCQERKLKFEKLYKNVVSPLLTGTEYIDYPHISVYVMLPIKTKLKSRRFKNMAYYDSLEFLDIGPGIEKKYYVLRKSILMSDDLDDVTFYYIKQHYMVNYEIEDLIKNNLGYFSVCTDKFGTPYKALRLFTSK